jgi:hypothetical protein
LLQGAEDRLARQLRGLAVLPRPRLCGLGERLNLLAAEVPCGLAFLNAPYRDQLLAYRISIETVEGREVGTRASIDVDDARNPRPAARVDDREDTAERVPNNRCLHEPEPREDGVYVSGRRVPRPPGSGRTTVTPEVNREDLMTGVRAGASSLQASRSDPRP